VAVGEKSEHPLHIRIKDVKREETIKGRKGLLYLFSSVVFTSKFKGSLTRDFQLLVFVKNQYPPWP
jgi:hypothetical protein